MSAATTPVERPYTMALRLCDGQRIDMPLLNRLRALGGHKPYPEDADIQCTGSAHLAGEHILCTSPVHAVGKPLNGWQTATVTNDALPERPEAVSNPLPEDLERVLADPRIVTPGDEKMHALIAAHARQHLDERVPAAAYLNLYALYEKERDGR